jgi:hypothetical protein
LTGIVLSLTATLTYAGDKTDYAVSNIPPELLKNANAVVRSDETRFELTDVDRARMTRRYAITILNERADDEAQFAGDYDKLHSIESVEGTLYDAAGKKVKSLKKADLGDYSGSGGENLIVDGRIKTHNFYCKLYPYTVEYTVETKFYYTMFFPRWVPMKGEHIAVQDSRMIFVGPSNYKVRYKAFNYPHEPAVQTEKSTTSYTWTLNNHPAIEDEYASPTWYEMTPVVFLGPDQFAVEGYKGNMETWQDFGKFVYALKQGRDVLPDAIRQKVHELTDNLSDPHEKVRKLYEFMQANTHYISIQLGIGGWQPFDAKYVAEKKYGDCKALSNYMYALLKEAGIASCYTLVKVEAAGHFILADFPSSQFNHVILCVPLKTDTVWLECTSQSLPAGYLGGFTSDRYVLLVDENGGKLVRTPKYKMSDNLQARKTVASVDAEGNLSALVTTRYQAEQMDDLQGLVANLSKEKLMKVLKSELDLPTYDVRKFDYQETKSAMPNILESLDLVAPNYAQVSGKRLFLDPNIMTRSQRRLNTDTARKFDIVLYYEYKDVDTSEISLPPGYQPESIPADVDIQSPFGHYSSKVKVQQDKVVYSRSMERNSGRWPAKDYAEMTKFYEQIFKADHSRVVLVKKE